MMKLEPVITPNPLIYDDVNSKPENVIRQENAVFISNLERNVGRSFIREAETLFSNRRIETFSRESFEHYLNKYVAKIRVDEWLDGSSFLNESIEFQVKIFEDLFSKSCTDTNLETNREELLSWKDKAKKGKALFVNCLMGVGKSYSIVKVLGQNPNLSAVIFMPTRKMCETIIQDIKNEIVRRNPNIRSYRQKREQEVEVYDENGNLVTDIIGEPVYEWTREFLEDQVYYVDGINEKECPHFEKIIKRYKYNWIEKKDYCFECENILTCRFRSHVVKACYSRIVVTTHQQYDHFYRKKILRKWLIFNHSEQRVKANFRDFFIVDEDLALSACYQPIALNEDEFEAFIATITKFLSDFSISAGEKTLQDACDKADKLFAQFRKCKTTSIISPIDPDFSFPEDIKKCWNESLPNQQDLIPEYFPWGEIVGNHIDILEHAITHGLVVQNYPHSYVKDGNKLQKRIYKAYFANPTTYDLSNLPPHIFFDGTMLDPKFLDHKFLKVERELIDIKVKALWKLQVRQNINTDLTQNKIPENRKAVETYLSDLLNQLGPNHKYYIVSSKSIRNAYLNNFLSENFIEYSFFVTHYGNLRGINEAKECDVGIMVGSFIPSDAVEIAMALDFIQDRLPTKKILKTLGKNNVWKWAESNTVRIYNPGFEVVSDLSKSFRLFEHRQAIARSRYIFHDVDFYVLSKDKIGDFESYAEVVDYQFRADLFSPRRREKDSKREQVETCANSILDKQDEVGESQIHEMRKISRTTIRKHLKAMVEEGALVKIRGKYHRNKNNNEKHHHLLF